MRNTIYGDSITFDDDADTVRVTVTGRRGDEVEIIFCTPKFVSALKGAEQFWADFQRKRAEAHIATLPRARKRAS